MKPATKTPCKQCPFRRTSPRGYLGSYSSPADFLASHYHADVPAPCHCSIDYEKEGWEADWKAGKVGRLCAGQAALYRNSCKQPRPPTPITPADDANPDVFDWTHEFLAHHMRDIP